MSSDPDPNLYACHYGREVDFIKVLDFGLVKQGRAPEEDADKADELASRLASVRTAEDWTPPRAKEWWDENRSASPAGAAEPVMA